MKTTFYYAEQPSELFHLKKQTTIWLPENQPSNPDMWKSNQTIATCSHGYMMQIRDRIQAGTIKPDEIVWIEIRNKKAIGFIFGASGYVRNFFRVV